MKPIDSPDTTREDREYWREVLKSHGLGMSKGNSKEDLSEEEQEATRLEKEIALSKAENSKPVDRGGRPRKRTRGKFGYVWHATHTDTPSNGFNIYTAKSHPCSLRRPGVYKDTHFITYIGGAGELVRLEEEQKRREAGRVTPPGHGPRVD